MKSLLRMLWVSVTVLGLVNFQAPPPANCQMSAGLFSAGCRMPCCPKSKVPLNCPLLKAEAPRDAIGAASPVFSNTLVALHTVRDTLSLRPLALFARLGAAIPAFQHWLRVADSPGRAPPVVPS